MPNPHLVCTDFFLRLLVCCLVSAPHPRLFLTPTVLAKLDPTKAGSNAKAAVTLCDDAIANPSQYTGMGMFFRFVFVVKDWRVSHECVLFVL